MAGTATYQVHDLRTMPGGKCAIIVDWTSDASGDVTLTIDEPVVGRIIQLVTDPDGTDAPTDNYDVTLVSSLTGLDMLAGRGVDRDTATVEIAMVLVEQTISGRYYASHPAVSESNLVFTVANAGDSKKGRAVIYLE